MAPYACSLILLICIISFASAQAQNSFINGLVHDGVSITADLPGSQQFKNIGSSLDGAGLCVFSSIEMAALYQGLEQMRGYRNWIGKKYRGGGWPEKVDQTLAAWFKEKNITPIPYLQYQGTKPQAILDLANKTNRMICGTYGFSPRYGSAIQHMTNCVLFDSKWAVVLDNNFPGEDRYEWMTRDEYVRRTIYPNKSCWLFIWLPPPPPPSPKNK